MPCPGKAPPEIPVVQSTTVNRTITVYNLRIIDRASELVPPLKTSDNMIGSALSRSAALVLLIGVLLFCAGTIVAEPFEQVTSLELYRAIANNPSAYQLGNVLTAVGFLMLVAALWQLTSFMQQVNSSPIASARVLLILAAGVWLAEIIGRSTLTTATAAKVAAGEPAPTAFPATVGIGLEPLFALFLLLALVGLALVVWRAGQIGLVGRRLSQLASLVTVASGAGAAVTYPWVGGVERALFYPLVLVFLPWSLVLLLRRPKATSPKPGAAVA